MDAAPADPGPTPPPGDPGPPWVVSFGMYGGTVPFEHPAALAAQAQPALDVILDHQRRRELPPGLRVVSSVAIDYDAKIRNASWKDGEVKAAAWARIVAKVGPEVEEASLHGADATLHLGVRIPPAAALRCQVGKAASEEADQVASSFFDVLRAGGSAEEVSSGFVHVDTCADPYRERVVAYTGLPPAPLDTVPGYYWAVLLTERHVELLGGRPRVEQEAPVWRVESIGAGRLLCVLAESPSALTADVVRAWRSFLAPVLAPGFPGPLESPYPTELRRPAWLFEGPLLPKRVALRLRRPAPAGPRAPEVTVEGGIEDRATVQVAWPPVERPDVVLGVVRAWTIVGRAYGYGEPRQLFLDASETEVGPSGATVQVTMPAEQVEAAVLHLATALGETGDCLDPDGTGPFGTIQVRPSA